MFSSLVKEILADFDESQASAINAIEERVVEILDNMPQDPLLFGNPPYIVDDGKYALLLISADGGCQRLHPSYRLSADSVNEDYKALYSLPAFGSGQILRLIPANQDYDFPTYHPDELMENIYGAEKLLNDYLNNTDMLNTVSVARVFAELVIAVDMALREDSSEDFKGISDFLRSADGATLLDQLAAEAVRHVAEEDAV